MDTSPRMSKCTSHADACSQPLHFCACNVVSFRDLPKFRENGPCHKLFAELGHPGSFQGYRALQKVPA